MELVATEFRLHAASVKYDRRAEKGRCDQDVHAEKMRGVGFIIPVMPQGAFFVFADASGWTDDSSASAFELLDKACGGVTPGVDFGQAGKRG